MRRPLVRFASGLLLLACAAAVLLGGAEQPTTRPDPAKRFRSTPVIQAIAAENPKQALALIAGGADVEATDTLGGTPLYYAAGAEDPGFLNVVQKLVASGANINRKARGGTALHEACFWGRPHIVRYLIQAGAAVNALDAYGHTPLHAAAIGWSENRATVVQLLISAGADISVTTKDSKKPLDIVEEKYPQDKASINLLKQAALHSPSTTSATKPSSAPS